ncbi:MAG: response regulator [Candidatus Dadabacteria bacterium]|nr:MAG: response regulator [Candidatus Dadabacteria bacterium]
MRKILIVSSDRENSETMKELSHKLGHSALVVSKKQTALEVLELNSDICLVIADVDLSNTEGKDLLQSIRERDSLKEIPIIITSGKIKMLEIDELLRLGAAYFVPKPIKEDYLAAYIKKLVP